MTSSNEYFYNRLSEKFMEERGIHDVTLNLKVLEASGCCPGIVKEIEPVYQPAEDATGYRYYQADGNHFFISREIRQDTGPLKCYNRRVLEHETPGPGGGDNPRIRAFCPSVLLSPMA